MSRLEHGPVPDNLEHTASHRPRPPMIPSQLFRRFAAAAFTMLAAMSAMTASAREPVAKKPDIIVIVSDDQGYAEEAARLLIQYGFSNLNLHKIWMELYEFDNKKLKFFAGLGFHVDGTLRDNCFEDGRYWNSKIISLLSAEYQSSNR